MLKWIGTTPQVVGGHALDLDLDPEIGEGAIIPSLRRAGTPLLPTTTTNLDREEEGRATTEEESVNESSNAQRPLIVMQETRITALTIGMLVPLRIGVTHRGLVLPRVLTREEEQGQTMSIILALEITFTTEITAAKLHGLVMNAETTVGITPPCQPRLPHHLLL